jgi:hypothetical protein
MVDVSDFDGAAFLGAVAAAVEAIIQLIDWVIKIVELLRA